MPRGIHMLGRKLTEKTKKKMSLAHLGHKPYADFRGEKNPFFGKHHTKETIEKIKLTRVYAGVKTRFKEGHLGFKNITSFIKGHIPWNKGKKRPEMTGKNHHNWKGGISEETDLRRRTFEYKEWRRLVIKRDNYICQICNKLIDKNIQAHHIRKFSDHPNLAVLVKNGITLCYPCHKVVDYHEEEWENYFFSNLIRRGFMPRPFGNELFIDAYGCQNSVLNDVEHCRQFLEETVSILKVQKQADPIVIVTPEQYKDKAGLSAWCALVESGVQCHTLIPTNFVSIDYYSCSMITNEVEEALINLTNKYWNPKRIDKKLIFRGVDYYA